MSASVSIPIAGFKDVYDVPARRKSAARASRLGQRGAARGVREDAAPRRPALHRQALGAARDGRACSTSCRTSPRCSRTSASTSRCASTRTIRVEVPPMLLLGEPGIGKTHFARKLSQLLGTGFGFVPMSSLTAGWVLSGASSQWKNAKPGKVFDTFVNGDYANPVIVVDEIDKASADGPVRPAGRALRAARDRDRDTLRRRVRRAADRRLGRGVARHRERRRRAFPSRSSAGSTVYEIDAPDAEGAARIARTIYGEIRSSHDWGRQFPEALVALGAAEARRAAAARDAPRDPHGVRQCQGRRALRGRARRHPGPARAQAEDRLLGSS